MAEYIERDTVIKALGDSHFKNYGNAIMVIKELPAADVVERDKVIDTTKSWLRANGKCPTCKRCSDNRNDGTTFCPIEESYVLPLDGFCHLYEPKEG